MQQDYRREDDGEYDEKEDCDEGVYYDEDFYGGRIMVSMTVAMGRTTMRTTLMKRWTTIRITVITTRMITIGTSTTTTRVTPARTTLLSIPPRQPTNVSIFMGLRPRLISHIHLLRWNLR